MTPPLDEYRIHDLLRKVLFDRKDKLQMQAHEALEKHYLELSKDGDVFANVEALYHANRCDWKRGVTEWIEAFEFAVSNGRFETCRGLLDVRSKLIVLGNLEEALILKLEGDFFLRLGQRSDSTQKYLQALERTSQAIDGDPWSVQGYRNQCDVLIRLGENETILSRFVEAIAAFERAIVACDKALEFVPYDASAHKSKGHALLVLGVSPVRSSQFNGAASSYAASISACDAALLLSPDYRAARHNKGITLKKRASLCFEFAEYEVALSGYEDTLETLDQVLAADPDNVLTLVVVGEIHHNIGTVQTKLNGHENALTNHLTSIKLYDKAVEKEPVYVVVYNHKASALSSVVDVQTGLYRYTEAQESCTNAILCLDEALQPAPNNYVSCNLQGRAYRLLAHSQLELLDHTQALSAYGRSLERHEKPFDNLRIMLKPFESVVLRLWIWLTTIPNVARTRPQLSIMEVPLKSFSEILRREPLFTAAFASIADIYRRLGNLRYRQGQYSDAASDYQLSIKTCETASRVAPTYCCTYLLLG